MREDAMSSVVGRVASAGFLFLSAGLILAGPAAARDDLLKDVKSRQEVAAQRMQVTVDDAKAEARRLNKDGNPAKAIEILRKALTRVRNDEDLPEERRKALVDSLQLQLQNYEKYSGDRRPERPADSSLPTRRIDLGSRDDGPRRIFDEMSRNHKDRVGAAVEARRVRDESGTGYLGVMASISKSNLLPSGDVEFPPDWAKKTAMRSTAAKMTDKERAIIRALNAPITIDLKDGATFQNVIDYLQEKMGVTIIVDKQALDEAMVTYETPVKLNLPKVATKTVLKKLLADFNLTYVVKDEAIQITTVERARDMLTTRIYYLGDLAAVVNPNLPPYITQYQTALNLKSIIDLIQSTIEPKSWDINGGPGTIVFNPATMSLIVKQSAEIHYSLGGLR
jgi:hypothetical protein